MPVQELERYPSCFLWGVCWLLVGVCFFGGGGGGGGVVFFLCLVGGLGGGGWLGVRVVGGGTLWFFLCRSHGAASHSAGGDGRCRSSGT